MPEQIGFQPDLISDIIWEEFEDSEDNGQELYDAIAECKTWKECNALLRKRELPHIAETIEDWLEDTLIREEAERKEQELANRAKAKEQAIEADAKKVTQMVLF